MVKRIYYPNNSLDKIDLALVMIAYAAAIVIAIILLQTVTPVIAINGEELSALGGGTISLTTMIHGCFARIKIAYVL